MSACHIPHITPGAFSKLPKLQELDISENFLVELSLDVIKRVPKLKLLNLDSNPWECHGTLKKFTEYCVRNYIAFTDPCISKTKARPEMFQRMQVSETTPEVAEEVTPWFVEKKSGVVPLCSPEDDKETYLLKQIIEISPGLTLLLTFTTGLMVGLTVACAINMLGQPSSRKRRVIVRRPIVRRKDGYQLPLVQEGAFEVGQTTPVGQRKHNSLTI